jgi:hypothetical protein
VSRSIAERLKKDFDVCEPELRLELAASHLIGLAFARYQLRIEPLASTGIEQLVASIGPIIERYLLDGEALAGNAGRVSCPDPDRLQSRWHAMQNTINGIEHQRIARAEEFGAAD